MNAATTDPRTEDVRAYIAAVRAWLADLPADDVEELTFGMEADLAERAAEGEVPLGDLLGEPEEYAAELRSAAGLPPRSATVEEPSSPGWATEVTAAVRVAAADALARWPWLRDLRPVWWVTRGVVAGWAVAMVLGTGHSVLLPAVGAVLSFLLGQNMAGGRAARVLVVAVTAGNVLAVLLLVPAVSWYLDGRVGDGGSVSESYTPPGLSLDGSGLTNLYVYDGQGNRVEGARVLTPDGRGVYVDPRTIADRGEVPLRADGTVDVANDVFPLVIGQRDPWEDPGYGWSPPLTLAPLPGATSSPSPSPSPAPSASIPSSPTPSPTPTATPSVG